MLTVFEIGFVILDRNECSLLGLRILAGVLALLTLLVQLRVLIGQVQSKTRQKKGPSIDLSFRLNNCRLDLRFCMIGSILFLSTYSLSPATFLLALITFFGADSYWASWQSNNSALSEIVAPKV